MDLIFVTLAFDFEDSPLILLGSGHQDGGLDKEPMVGLDLGLLALLLLLLGLELDRVPVILLIAAAQDARPRVLLLNITSGENSSHDLELDE